MAIFISIVVLIAALGISAAAASKMQHIAEMKGHTERYWAWCFWLAPIGYAMVIALPDRGRNAAAIPSAKAEADELPEL